ncbi:hypothetical protein CC78DRAFT_288850 [Lojkania enalia]|uniref:Uncharacterized protein n=1 Tax=Lojkania enalia TaxID=147567 RepID=A0A9P4KBX0_9PLEO|nr:hypothetical protein CC78DRAFT_288850 [Didymosphaeria enalia]
MRGGSSIWLLTIAAICVSSQEYSNGPVIPITINSSVISIILPYWPGQSSATAPYTAGPPTSSSEEESCHSKTVIPVPPPLQSSVGYPPLPSSISTPLYTSPVTLASSITGSYAVTLPPSSSPNSYPVPSASYTIIMPPPAYSSPEPYPVPGSSESVVAPPPASSITLSYLRPSTYVPPVETTYPISYSVPSASETIVIPPPYLFVGYIRGFVASLRSFEPCIRHHIRSIKSSFRDFIAVVDTSTNIRNPI